MVIGGNITGMIQISTGTEKNEISEAVKSWADVQMITGWLDLQGGGSNYNTYNAKIQESTHIFVADYMNLDSRIESENSRMVISGKVYDVLLIDDPMELHKQLEFYLKYTGGQ